MGRRRTHGSEKDDSVVPTSTTNHVSKRQFMMCGLSGLHVALLTVVMLMNDDVDEW